MFYKILPRDNEWNRKYEFAVDEAIGFLIDWKLGQAFFGWKYPNNTEKFFKCEQEVFEKNFRVLEEQIVHEFDPFDNIHFLRYPVEQ